MKTFRITVTALVIIALLASCSSTKCAQEGCDETAVANGYCEYHNTVHEITEGLADAAAGRD